MFYEIKLSILPALLNLALTQLLLGRCVFVVGGCSKSHFLSLDKFVIQLHLIECSTIDAAWPIRWDYSKLGNFCLVTWTSWAYTELWAKELMFWSLHSWKVTQVHRKRHWETDYTQRERNSDDLSTHKLLKPPYLPCNHMRHGEAGPLSWVFQNSWPKNCCCFKPGMIYNTEIDTYNNFSLSKWAFRWLKRCNGRIEMKWVYIFNFSPFYLFKMFLICLVSFIANSCRSFCDEI